MTCQRFSLSLEGQLGWGLGGERGGRGKGERRKGKGEKEEGRLGREEHGEIF